MTEEKTYTFNGGFKIALQIVLVTFACGIIYQKVSATELAVEKMGQRFEQIGNRLHKVEIELAKLTK